MGVNEAVSSKLQYSESLSQGFEKVRWHAGCFFYSSFLCGRALRRTSFCLNTGLVMNGSSGGSFIHSQKRPNIHEGNACTDADEFPRAVAKTAVAQICEGKGFHSIQLSALETLADIAIRYLCDTGKASQFYANLAGRTQSNALDVLCAVEDINGGGFTHAHRAMATSDTPAELKRFVEETEESPFCKPVPHFPIHKKQTPIPSFTQVGEKPPGGHIPPWLPAFPDVHTYKATPMWNERKADPSVDKLQQAKQRRKAEQSLVSLHSRLSTVGVSSLEKTPSDLNGPQEMKLWGFSSSKPLEMNEEGITPSVQNPSVSSSLRASANGPAVLPSIFEAFAPALEAATLTVQETNGAASNPGAYLLSSKKGLPFIMKFDFGSRAIQKAVAAGLSLGGKEQKRGLPELRDDEKDEKKKRAYQILAQSLEGLDGAPNETRH